MFFATLYKLLAELTKAIVALGVNIAANTREQAEANRLQFVANHLTSKTNKLLKQLLDRFSNLPNPGPISLSVTGENGSMLKFKITLPALPPEPNDIASGVLTLKIGDGEEQTIPTTKDQAAVDGLSGEQGATVVASLVYLDDAGNSSIEPTKFEAVLNDTIPPPNPGALGLEVTAEE